MERHNSLNWTGWILLAVSLALTSSCSGGDTSPVVPEVPRIRSGTVVVVVRHHFTQVFVQGARVTLTRSGHDTRATATNATGEATLTGVEVGTWDVSFDPPAGFVVWPGRPVPQELIIAEGETIQHLLEFVTVTEIVEKGNIRLSVIERGFEGGIILVSGARISLLNGSGVVAELTTPGDFEDLPEGVYTLTVTPPEGYALAPTESGSRTVQVIGRRDALVDRFVLVATSGKGGIWGVLGQGPRDATFVAAVGARIEVIQDGAVISTTVAPGFGGGYWLGGLTAGDQLIRIVPPSGWSFASGQADTVRIEILQNLFRRLDVLTLVAPGG